MRNPDKTSPDYRVGQVVLQARRDADLTQGELAALMSSITGTTLHKTAISKIEAGQRPLSFAEAAAVSSILPVPLNELAQPLRPADIFQKWDRTLDSFSDLSNRFAHLAGESDLVMEDLGAVLEFLEDDSSKRGPLADDRERLLELVPEMESLTSDAAAALYGFAEKFSKLRRHASA